MITPIRVPLLGGAKDKPSIEIDFLKGYLDSRFTFARAGAATYYGSDGLRKTASSGVPRFDHDPDNAYAPAGLLLEDTATNLILRSDALDNASWTKTKGSVVANQATDPAGNATMDRFKGSAAAEAFANISQAATVSAETEYTVSFDLQQDTNAKMQAVMFTAGTTWGRKVNFTAGTLETADGGLTAPDASTITDLGGGNFRVTMTATTGAGETTLTLALYLVPDGGTWGTNSDEDDSFYAGGIQMEAGTYASSYIKTEGSTVARVADTLYIAAGDDFDHWFNQTEGSFLMECDLLSRSGGATAIQIDDDSNDERYVFTQSGGSLGYLVVDGASTVVNTAIGAWDIGSIKFSAAYRLNDFAASDEGSAITTDTTGTLPTVTQITFGATLGTAVKDFWHMKKFTYWPYRRPNFELVQLSA